MWSVILQAGDFWKFQAKDVATLLIGLAAFGTAARDQRLGGILAQAEAALRDFGCIFAWDTAQDPGTTYCSESTWLR